jgi:hypothetical protein
MVREPRKEVAAMSKKGNHTPSDANQTNPDTSQKFYHYCGGIAAVLAAVMPLILKLIFG